MITTPLERDVETRIGASSRVDPETNGWVGRLELQFEREGARTVLARRKHTGPLRVQKPLYPEGPCPCQTIIVHPPGGIVAGDSLAIDIDAGLNTHVQVTAPGASKWYRSTGRVARADTVLRIGPGALIEWLPQETLIFDGARAAIGIRVELAAGARFIGWEITHLGRTASRERFESGHLLQRFEIARNGALVWCERAVHEGSARALNSGAILGGLPAFGTFIVACGPVDDDLLEACRKVGCTKGEGAVTRLPETLVARYRGASARGARTYFAALWRAVRPRLVGHEAVPPRIWST
jgi:urease accessory protein